ncbi:hypothetical protein DW355_13905 [Hylemonella gracilis]|uniref:Succinate dehydrogenase n=1 Tax=Hylemonella gracilis TaxID=80880 RepID=A0A4P6UPR2_9BURK|nr:hypothetical protein [Hylemonella gracilis]QBK05671.1 hypothetical protein DW355_13905 [Hylemonella gracilis]
MDLPATTPTHPDTTSTSTSTSTRTPRNTGFVLTRLRLISGLTMFTFIVTHLINHALGLVSPEVMAAGQRLFFFVWHSLPGALLLTVAALTHLSLVLYKQIVRRTLRMPWIEGLRILLGILTLLGLSLHATPMVLERLQLTGSGQPVAYPDFIQLLISGSPMLWNQLALVIAAWTHGCIGVHLWLRLRGWYRQRLTLFAVTAVLVPLLALLGVLAAARAVQSAADSGQTSSYGEGYGANSAAPAYGEGTYGAYGAADAENSNSGVYGGYGGGSYGSGYGDNGSGPYGVARRDADQAWLAWLIPTDPHSAQSVYGALIVITLLILATVARGLVQTWERRHGLISVRYPRAGK